MFRHCSLTHTQVYQFFGLVLKVVPFDTTPWVVSSTKKCHIHSPKSSMMKLVPQWRPISHGSVLKYLPSLLKVNRCFAWWLPSRIWPIFAFQSEHRTNTTVPPGGALSGKTPLERFLTRAVLIPMSLSHWTLGRFFRKFSDTRFKTVM